MSCTDQPDATGEDHRVCDLGRIEYGGDQYCYLHGGFHHMGGRSGCDKRPSPPGVQKPGSEDPGSRVTLAGDENQSTRFPGRLLPPAGHGYNAKYGPKLPSPPKQ